MPRKNHSKRKKRRWDRDSSFHVGLTIFDAMHMPWTCVAARQLAAYQRVCFWSTCFKSLQSRGHVGLKPINNSLRKWHITVKTEKNGIETHKMRDFEFKQSNFTNFIWPILRNACQRYWELGLKRGYDVTRVSFHERKNLSVVMTFCEFPFTSDKNFSERNQNIGFSIIDIL